MDKKERLKEVYKYLRDSGQVHTQKEFAASLGKAEGTISKAFKGDEKALTDNLMCKIAGRYKPIFSLEWLLTGNGTMLIRDMKDEPEEQPYNEPVNTLDQGSVINAMISSYNEHIEDLKKTIKQLNSQIEQKDIELARKDEIIRNLSEALKKEREQTNYILPVGIAEEKPLIK